jgi:hypothetical protein
MILDQKEFFKKGIEIRIEAAKKLKNVCLGEIKKQSLRWDPPNTNTIIIIDGAPTDPKVKFHNRCIKDARHQYKNSYPPIEGRSNYTSSTPKKREILGEKDRWL